MARLLLIAVLVTPIAPGAVFGQDETHLFLIDAKTPRGLGELFNYDGGAMPVLSAHRGGALPGYPENCIATFEHTLRHTFSMLEIDLQFSKDGHIVLHHDSTLDRTTTGTGPVADRTLKQLKQLRLKDRDGKPTDHHMPTLNEALQWARGKTIVILDKKQVPVEICVKKIQEHRAQAYAMVMAYSFEDIQTCHKLDADIMMEVMIGNQERFRDFQSTGVPWNRVIVFVGHSPPDDKRLLQQIHAQRACCMAGTSRNLDRQLRVASQPQHDQLRLMYRSRLDFGIDLIETDLAIQVGALLYDRPKIPVAKARFFHLPGESRSLRSEPAHPNDSGSPFPPD